MTKQYIGLTGSGSSCGACKFLRRKCILDCMFAPYFSYEEAAAHFAAIHRFFGASNVSKMLLRLPLHDRGEAAAMICYEALARVHDPVYGCVSHIFALQHQVAVLKEEIENIERQMTDLEVDTSKTSNLHSFVPYSLDQTCCSNIKVQVPEIQHQLCFEPSALEQLLQQLCRDNY